jgi:serralysin
LIYQYPLLIDTYRLAAVARAIPCLLYVADLMASACTLVKISLNFKVLPTNPLWIKENNMTSIVDTKRTFSSDGLEHDQSEPNDQLRFNSPSVLPEEVDSSTPEIELASVEHVDKPKQVIGLGKTDIPTATVPLDTRLTESKSSTIVTPQTNSTQTVVNVSDQPSIVLPQSVSLSPNLALVTRFEGTLATPNPASSSSNLPSVFGRCQCSYCSPGSKTSSSQAEEAFGDKTEIADVRATGDNNIDGLLTTKRWKSFDVTYSYTNSYDNDYEENYGRNLFSNYQNGFEQLSVDQIRAVVGWLEFDFANVSNLNPILLIGNKDRDATVRIAMTAKTNLNTARVAAFPEDNRVESGDVWFNADDYDTPVIGNYAYHTFGHELGHAMGLKHGHITGGISDVAMDSDRDSMEFSVMTYRSHVGGSTTGGYTNETWGYAQTLMMYDIRAIQQMYGADFGYNSGNSMYTFSTTTGEMFIDGVGQGTPGANRIFRTVWDGNGIDTYNFGNYTTNLRVDLTPGGWSDLAVETNFQRAELNTNIYARGHVFNALIYTDSNPNWIENAIGGSGNDVIIGNDANNHLNGVGGNDTLYGGFGNDTIDGGGGNDVIFLGEGNDLVNTFSSDSDFFYGEGGEDFIFGSLANDYLSGGTGNDTLRGLSGDDTLIGDAGLDNTFGDAGNDKIVDTDGISFDNYFGGAGIDTIDYSSFAFGGSVTIDLMSGRVTGSAGNIEIIEEFENVEGSQGGEVIIGSDVDNILCGNDGIDVIHGGSGNDTIEGGSGDDYLQGNSGNNVLDGGSGNDFIDVHRNGGNDTLSGGFGNDTLSGGFGNDVYTVDSVGDVVEETSTLATEIDSVLSSISYALTENVEQLYLLQRSLVPLPGDNINGSGNSLNNLLTGNIGDNILFGLAGNDTLNGGFDGNDSLFGGDGNDVYVVDSISDVVQETSTLGSEIDTVRSFVSYTMGANLERLSLQGTSNINATGNSLNNLLVGNTGNNSLSGLAGNDTLTAGAGSDTLDGGTGQDLMVGGTGNDFYVVDNAGDIVQETSLVATEIDTVRSFISYSLGSNLERLSLQAVSNINAIGNNLSNLLVGNAGNNLLNGQFGNDTLTGNAGNDVFVGAQGNDTLTGGGGNDSYHYVTGAGFSAAAVGIDRITDFGRVAGNRDNIMLSRTTFSSGTSFASVSSDALAGISAAFITFSKATGNLFYNQNGATAGLGTGGQFATLSSINGMAISGTNTLLATDLNVIA